MLLTLFFMQCAEGVARRRGRPSVYRSIPCPDEAWFHYSTTSSYERWEYVQRYYADERRAPSKEAARKRYEAKKIAASKAPGASVVVAQIKEAARQRYEKRMNAASKTPGASVVVDKKEKEDKVTT